MRLIVVDMNRSFLVYCLQIIEELSIIKRFVNLTRLEVNESLKRLAIEACMPAKFFVPEQQTITRKNERDGSTCLSMNK